LCVHEPRLSLKEIMINQKFRNPNRHNKQTPATACEGILEVHPNGFGFLRLASSKVERTSEDIFVPGTMVEHHQLKQGSFVQGLASPHSRHGNMRLRDVEAIDGLSPMAYRNRPDFDSLRPVSPRKWLRLEQPTDGSTSMRILDLLTPIGFGQRALIASPPRAGKTTLLKQVGHSVLNNYPDTRLVVLLIDERPEEVTEMQEELGGDVFASCIDQDAQQHTRLAQIVIDRCKQDVVLLIDSLTRMARSFNKLTVGRGAIGAGGLGIHALNIPKKVFSSARATADGGSLTILATALIETENRMDEVIFQEFKGTGNMDLVLSQSVADQRIFPAIDIAKSTTRRVELLHDEKTLRSTTALRRSLLMMKNENAVAELVEKMDRFPTNEEFLRLIDASLIRR